jgi:ankyrin repeat protein
MSSIRIEHREQGAARSTALHAACASGRMSIAEKLVRNGADTNLRLSATAVSVHRHEQTDTCDVIILLERNVCCG